MSRKVLSQYDCCPAGEVFRDWNGIAARNQRRYTEGRMQ